jgi:hypothetical protein
MRRRKKKLQKNMKGRLAQNEENHSKWRKKKKRKRKTK